MDLKLLQSLKLRMHACGDDGHGAAIRVVTGTLHPLVVETQVSPRYCGDVIIDLDNLLAYARITDVTETYSFDAMAAAELVEEALRSFGRHLMEGGIVIDVDTPQELPFVRADQRAMVLALRNLIDNAIRHVRNDGHIRISASLADSRIFIEVRAAPSGRMI